MCKRIVMSWDYCEVIQRSNVKLVTDGIERIEPRGARTLDGHLHELDVLALTNAQGRTLHQAWDARGPHAHYSLAVPGFPNFFLLSGPHIPLANGSVIRCTEALVSYVTQCRPYVAGRFVTLAPTQAATEAFYAELRDAMKSTVWVSGCQNWYLGEDGLPEV